MRACTTANAIFLGVILGAALFSACASSGTQPQTSGGDSAANATNGTDKASSTNAAPTEAVGTNAASDPAKSMSTPAPKQPETVADCKDLKTDITNEPPSSAVPMNNATAPGDAGPSDRLQPMVEVIKSNRDKFRCCFDIWARKNPGSAGRVSLKVKLKPDGTLITAETVEKDSTVAAPEVHSCIVEVAKSITYPKSPSGKETTYTHPFDFKARKLIARRSPSREQGLAREAWFASLSLESKAESLFELETLLKGITRFDDPRNHPSDGRCAAAFDLNYHEHLRLVRSGIARVVELSGSLLCNQSIEQSTLHTRIDREPAWAISTPASSLASLRRGLVDIIDVQESLLRNSHVGYRVFRANLAIVRREAERSCFFCVRPPLDFRPELDRISSPKIAQFITTLRGTQPRRLVTLAFLSISRLLRALKLINTAVLKHQDEPCMGRVYVILAAIRTEVRALSIELDHRAGDLLAHDFERDLARVPASDIAARESSLRTEGKRLASIRQALAGFCSNLRLEMRRAFEDDLPLINAHSNTASQLAEFDHVASNVRAGLHVAALYLARSLGADIDESDAFGDEASDPATRTSERLRRDVWMFAHIARAFASKARYADEIVDRWSVGTSTAFVRDFLGYYRAMGYPLLRTWGYPSVETFMAAMTNLENIELLDDARIETAVHESETFVAFLTRLFHEISMRDELVSVHFNRRDAARALRIYVGSFARFDPRNQNNADTRSAAGSKYIPF